MNATPKMPLRWYKSGNGLALLLLGSAAAGYGVIQYWDQVVFMLPWVFIAACPVLHLFLHGGHGRHAKPDPAGLAQPDSQPDSEAQPSGSREVAP